MSTRVEIAPEYRAIKGTDRLSVSLPVKEGLTTIFSVHDRPMCDIARTNKLKVNPDPRINGKHVTQLIITLLDL